jgi:hypothetical protein
MRTKALLCVASLAAGVTATMAQSNVYSTNVVGYYELNIPANKYVLLANQLNTTNNTIGEYFGNFPGRSDFPEIPQWIYGLRL